LILVNTAGHSYAIPKRAIPDDAAVQQVRALLQNKIRNVSFLAAPSGFAVLPKPVLPVDSESSPATALT